MLRAVLAACCLAGIAGPTTPGRAADFNGWQTMRVVAVEGQPERFYAADLNGDGRQELIVVNTRQSRIDLYRRLIATERKPLLPGDPDRPNDLPLAPDWSHTEIALDDLPADAAAVDVDGDERPELVVLSGPTLKLTAFKLAADGKWTRLKQWDLLAGQLAGRGKLLLPRTAGDSRELLVSCEQGIQMVALTDGARPVWYHPREKAERVDWWSVDLDGDGDEDVLEWTAKGAQSVRWYECVGGVLRPPQALLDQGVQQVGCWKGLDGRVEVLVRSTAQPNVVRRYQPSRGEAAAYGRRAMLPLANVPGAPWCGVKLGDSAALAAVDPGEPKIRLYRLLDDQWGTEESFPTIGGIRDLAAPSARPGTLLLWLKDAGDLYESRWENGRLSYPRPRTPSGESTTDRKITALECVGDTVWWAQRVGEDLDLYVWPADAGEPQRTRFNKAGVKVERVQWLGGKRLLVQQAFAGGAKLVELVAGKTSGEAVIAEPPHLSKVNFAEYKLYDDGGKLRIGRLADGVLQWLDDDLNPVDQVMLPDGQKLAGFLPNGTGDALALEQGGGFLHGFKFDAAGIGRTTSSVKLSGGVALRRDPVLGLIVADMDHIARLAPGQPWELKLAATIDARERRAAGAKEATIHRFLTADVTGDRESEIILCDDRRHQLTVLDRQGTEMREAVSWQVYEDQSYPYGDERSNVPVAEPRNLLGLNADGDEFYDFALLCQDRLLVYLGREEKRP